MNDDLLAGAILPVDDTSVGADFDPDAIESDDLLDDAEDLLLDGAAPAGALDDEDVLSGVEDE